MAKRRDRQQVLSEDMEPVKELEDAGNALVDASDKKKAARETQRDAEAHLLKMMNKHELTEYKFGGRKAIIESGDTHVKLKKVKITETANA